MEVKAIIIGAAMLLSVGSATAKDKPQRIASPPGFDRVQTPWAPRLTTPRGNWKPQPMEEVQWDYTAHTMNQPLPPTKGWWSGQNDQDQRAGPTSSGYDLSE